MVRICSTSRRWIRTRELASTKRADGVSITHAPGQTVSPRPRATEIQDTRESLDERHLRLTKKYVPPRMSDGNTNLLGKVRQINGTYIRPEMGIQRPERSMATITRSEPPVDKGPWRLHDLVWWQR